MERFVTPGDAARILGVTPEAVRQMIRRGTLAADGLLEQGTWLIRRAVVEQLAMERLSRTTGQTIEHIEDTELERESESLSNG
jgi:Mn-dependent DtxR family transcriptional regulator